MRIVLLGCPGAGKGSLASLILEKHHIPYLSTGAYFRKEVADNTDLGKEIKHYMESGLLVPDSVTMRVASKMLEAPENENYLLDGFPRTVNQAMMLDELTTKLGRPLQVILNLYVKDDEVVYRRLTGRQICSKCGAIYHTRNHPSKVEGVCDVCGANLVIRKDDQLESVKIRLNEYYRLTEPMVDYYKMKGNLIELDAELDSEVLLEEVNSLLEKYK
ncbi:MAG: nucleoside monophosphate kinase [Bacillales bacterium]|jgi:adenylate kinase|nr:nucleoside monophosphate kinase [Bacillales bacterium]